MNAVKKKELTSSLAKHVLETGHSIDFEGTKTIAVIQHQRQRIIRETLEIAKRPNCLNKRDDGIRLSDIWKVALNGD